MKLIIALGMCAGLLGENARAEGTNMAASVPQSMESFDRNSDNERFNRAVAAPLSSEERGRGEVELLFHKSFNPVVARGVILVSNNSSFPKVMTEQVARARTGEIGYGRIGGADDAGAGGCGRR